MSERLKPLPELPAWGDWTPDACRRRLLDLANRAEEQAAYLRRWAEAIECEQQERASNGKDGDA